jgi:hopanoid biosynthesis associated protein HpnK
MRRLIITGDDFGLAVPVNEAVEEAHRRGVLTTASLMVGAEHAADAVQRARRLPGLHVGLHLVLVEGRPVSPPAAVPDLVDESGGFSTRLFASGVRFFFLPDVRRQLETEIRAQFDAFCRTGLRLDHVNAHNHMHLHPTVLGIILTVAREHGAPAVRVPFEAFRPVWRASQQGRAAHAARWAGVGTCATLAKRRIRRAGYRCNDFVMGLHDTGRMHGDVVYRLLAQLPDGVTEMYFHPATRRCAEIDATMSGYQHEREFETLLDPRMREAIRNAGAELLTFSDL